ncbi:MAG: hypothetical protein JSS75_09825 [Bacteroidetes bacterium]|nr:hypothetical protein [Bacteroidota bacterium]
MPSLSSPPRVVLTMLLIGLQSCLLEVKDDPNLQHGTANDQVRQIHCLAVVPDSQHALEVLFCTRVEPGFGQHHQLDWDFGDGSPLVRRNDTLPLLHAFPRPNRYRVRVTLVDTITRSTVTDTTFALKVRDSIPAPPAVSIEYSVPDPAARSMLAFRAVSLPRLPNGVRFDWEFGDTPGAVSSFDTAGILHLYKISGGYRVKLTVLDTSDLSTVTVSTRDLVLRDDPVLLHDLSDTAYLHSFTGVSVMLNGVVVDTVTDESQHRTVSTAVIGKSLSYDEGPIYTGGGIGYGPLVENISWRGSTVEYQTHNSWSQSNGNPYNPSGSSGSTETSVAGTIDPTDNSLHAMKFTASYRYDSYGQAMRSGGGSTIALSVYSLKVESATSDRLVCSASGDAFKAALKSFAAAHGHFYNYYGDSGVFGPLLWDTLPVPSVRVVFYR